MWYNELSQKIGAISPRRQGSEMYSMTGFGKGEYREGGLTVTVELKSVNNRFLDLAVKCPHALAPYEEDVRALLRSRFARGRIDVFVSLSDLREKPKTPRVDLSLAEGYMEAAHRLKERFPSAADDISLSYLLRLPDVVRFEEEEGEDGALKPALLSAAEKAADALEKMRFAEGERLKQDVLARGKEIASLRDKMELRAPLVAEEYRKKLTERIQEYLQGKADETRILTEAAVFADKCSIDEELTRLKSHVAELQRICSEQTVGRKLDFLIQEFNRECNTVCSKSNDSELTALALKMKNEIEKVREQIQNLE